MSISRTIRDWNDLPESLISSSEHVSKFTSLVRAGTDFPRSQLLVRDCQFGVSPLNYSDSYIGVHVFLFGSVQPVCFGYKRLKVDTLGITLY